MKLNAKMRNFAFSTCILILSEICSVFGILNVGLIKDPTQLNLTASIENLMPKEIGPTFLPVKVSAELSLKPRERKPQPNEPSIYTYTADQRFKAINEPQSAENWTLVLKHPDEQDTGIYECQISTTPPKSHYVCLQAFAVSPCGPLATSTNSESVCGPESCRMACEPGYITSSGEENLVFLCQDSQWVNAKSGKSVVEKCKPVCNPQCQNGGKCIKPNVCECGMNFDGPTCEQEKLQCKTIPSTPLYSFKKCQAGNCTFKCMPGKEFPDGSTSVQLYCEADKWVSSNSAWTTLPNCQAICNPPCLNGGKCIDTGTCFCLKDFRGKECQYPVSNCDASKLSFNGNYHCNGDEEHFSCQLSCPGNAESTESFAPHYNCSYAEGQFKPVNVPQCRIGTVIESTKISRHKSKWYSTSSTATSCVLWNTKYLKALNQQIFNFKNANCIYTLLQDDLEHLFQIQVDMNEQTIRKLIIYINNMKYELSKNADGKPILMSEGNDTPLTIPCQLTDLKVEIGSGMSVAVFLPATNLYLVWSKQGEIQVDVSAEFFNRTTGLCGRGSTPLLPSADLQVHFKNAAVSSLTDQCSHTVEDPGYCEGSSLNEAIKACESVIKSGPISEKCKAVVPTSITEEYMNSCIWSHCNGAGESEARSKVVCFSASKYVQTCSQLSPEVNVDWREHSNCSISCPPNQVHTNCVPVTQATCAANEVLPTGLQRYCQEGCVCESGYVLHGEKCIKKEDCPCTYGGEAYDPQSVIPKDCNKCICMGGKWACTEGTCKAECLLYSGLHYRTFDGKKFDFTGSCSYTLLSSDNVTIVQEHTSIVLPNSKIPRQLKTFVISVGDKKVALRESNEILINNREIEALPASVDGEIHIRRASTLLTEVTLPDGFHIFWNGEDNFKIFANSSVLGKTKGLCGTFNNNQQDDFLTPEGDVEHDVHVFASSWKTSERCASEKVDLTTACDTFVQNKHIAENFCKNITTNLFKTCNAIVNPNEYYETCLTDVCACEQNDLAKCFCPSVSAYAQECARQGVVIDWRKEIRTCGVQCNVGQKFEPCGMSCQRSCSDISDQVPCHGTCTEGCYCPTGYTLDKHEVCIPISECPCTRNGRKHPAGYVDLRNNSGVIESCACKNAAWICTTALTEEVESYQRQKKCSSPNMEYVDCEPPEPTTCRNMQNPPQFSSKTCTPGCVCKEGFVLESLTKKCVKPKQCPCHHGGQIYSDGEIIHQDCNNCTCYHGSWKCTTKECPATCAAWGDSHFRSFDGKFFDFQGTCDYLFAKGSLADDKAFSINIQIVPCGSGGISCTKSITINVGKESATLDKDVDNYSKKTFKNFDIISTGLYVVVTLRGLSVTLQWDKGTRVSLHVNPKWRNKLSGLCGNYNGNGQDDFQTPSGGLVEVSPILFADSWKLQQHCPLPYEIQDTCLLHPNRKFWSTMKCSQLKDNPVFKRCHSQVPVDEFYRRCVFDSCACDQGGDCECLCTAFAAYAQECNAKGISLKWRGQDLCPVQCEPHSNYSPCISACPAPTCNNLGVLDSTMDECRDLPCVEGCQSDVSCPFGKVLQNNTCVAPVDCDCMNHNGQIFKENEKISGDECHSCYCSKGKKVCTGKPCSQKITTPPPTPKKPAEIICIDGWSNWLSIPSGKEILLGQEKALKLGNYSCPAHGMLNVRCRKQTYGFLSILSGLRNLDCGFGKKIICDRKYCSEIQIMIKCNCSAGIIDNDGENDFVTPVVKCKVKCDRLCHHYKHELHASGRCQGTETCIEGYSNVTCPQGSYWRDEMTCVPRDACTCASQRGSLIKPSTVVEESDCSTCQCLNNEYVCTQAACASSTTETYSSITPTSTEFITPEVTLSPLPICSSDRLILIDDKAEYNASSSSPERVPKVRKNRSENDTDGEHTVWRAQIVDSDQYLDIDLDRIQPVYGVEVSGDAENVEYVQAYQVLYSSDGVSYSYAKPALGEDKQFRGPYDQNARERQLFQTPVEARYLRVKPVLWHNWISMLVRVLGCELAQVTPIPTVKCDEPMGLEDGRMHPSQVSVSSTLFHNFTAADASLSSSTGWAPFIASSDQFIQFDFLDERRIEGVKLKGAHSFIDDRAWVEAFKVKYSLDGVNWNTILNADKSEMVFSGNYDDLHVHSNVFEPPLRTRFLRLYPVKWINFPTLAVEVMGCYEPYPAVVTTPAPIEQNEVCNVCSGIISSNCSCVGDTFWDGVNCVKKEYCPCVEGLLTYTVGSVYTKLGCQKCACSIGGLSTCHAAAEDCPDCAEQGQLKQVNDDCTCECIPCPEQTRLCVTSNFCLNESLWCNGYKECADDETDCPTTSSTTETSVTESTTTETTTVAPPTPGIVCPPTTCPEGYTAVFSQLKSGSKGHIAVQYGRKEGSMKTLSFNQTVQIYAHSEETDFESSSVSIVKTRGKLSENCSEYLAMQKEQSKTLENVDCRDWTCVANGVTCDKPTCPPGTRLTVKWTGEACPAYECLVPPPTEKECSISGRLISTFDGSSFKYDMCNHILARDFVYNTWSVRRVTKCPFVGPCVFSLDIKHDQDHIELYTNFTATYNGYKYTISQLQAIGSRSKSFSVQPISTKHVIFTSLDLKFTVILGSDGYTKIIVASALHNMIDGLCGFFDFAASNDKRKPDGTAATSTQEFGDSWKMDVNDICEAKVCPKEVQTKATEICDTLKQEPFSMCDLTIDTTEAVAKCYETICSCATATNDFEKDCRCNILHQFATKCLSSQPGVDLSSWRLKYECPVTCPAPFVYRDCYDRVCEPDCDSLLQEDRCPRVPNRCFPGCYCPEGLIRKGDTCIKSSECRDCVCNSNGLSQFTTFDQVQGSFDGSCSSFTMLQTKPTELSDGDLRVIVTNAPCTNPLFKGVCPHSLTVIFDSKVVLLSQSHEDLNKVKVRLDSTDILEIPYTDDSMNILQEVGKLVKLSIPSLQLDVTFMAHNKGFQLQLPSSMYQKKLEGLCGTCNHEPTDDIQTPTGEVAEKLTDFLTSWKTNYTADTEKQKCVGYKQEIMTQENFTVECAVPTKHDPCATLLKPNIFGKCHAIVGPTDFVELCHKLICQGDSHCHALEAYVEECQEYGVCVEWRDAHLCPYSCPEGFVYEACSLGCEVNCDNYKQLKDTPEWCAQPRHEKCACPSGQVLSNGVCINELRCKPCDEHNHYVGDKWSVDNCTQCECAADRSLNCQTKQCPGATVCPVSMIAQIDPNNDDACCEKYVCVVEETNATCPEPIVIECSKDQVVKLDVHDNNCTYYVCVCIPREECPTPLAPELLPGMVMREKKEGCCPSLEAECDQSLCPKPTTCPPYHSAVEQKSPGDCCPRVKCELPANTCLHEYHWIADFNVSERTRSPTERLTELKNVGDTWTDGPCHMCHCTADSPKAVCNEIKCPAPIERESYVMKPFHTYGECCPTYKFVACRWKGQTYEINSKWSDSVDPCKKLECEQNAQTGELLIKEIVKSCATDCELGWRYTGPEREDECCGSCKQDSCVEGNILHPINSTWTSEDGCIKFECDEMFNIRGLSETCPNIEHCPEERVYTDGCCKKCKFEGENLVNCAPVSIRLEDTVKQIIKVDPEHGNCTNLEPIEGFSRCDGSCPAPSFFDAGFHYDSSCNCCLASKFDPKEVQLTCPDDGHKMSQTIYVPSKCGCQSRCGESRKLGEL